MTGLSEGRALYDGYGRRITYLRVSVTDKCNLRCVYCMPEEGVEPRRHHDLLRLEEISRVIRVAARLGIEKVRITGGEPLVRKGLPDLVRMIASITEIRDLSMTTNGTLLAGFARDLVASGLKRVNISLDTLKPDVYSKMTRCGDIQGVFAGIAAAETAGLLPIRLNAVVVRGMNDGEIEDLARLTLEHAWDVRFIELMPFWGNGGRFERAHVVPVEEIRERVRALGALPEASSALPAPEWSRAAGALSSEAAPAADDCAGPASYMRLPGAAGRVGFISREGDGFCVRCNRLRLTAEGKLMPCLLSDLAVDLRAPLRAGADDDAIASLIRKAVSLKPAAGAGRAGGEIGACRPPLSDIGG
ncbi:MAG: GTP 3',8-cyclase MoaA [Firmicutes bacterium]|jgi:cyclic pyranopterin phosphate synthase|nr:GTP 3',8-cyclase MoaA [Bacillota bacterium]MDH7494551.1 GTP 3',8-cyclase MoaA [Bacillota bacterium]